MCNPRFSTPAFLIHREISSSRTRSAAQADPGGGSPVTEMFITFEFTLPKGVLLPPTTLGDVYVWWTPPGPGEEEKAFPPQPTGNRIATWDREKEKFALSPHVSGISIPPKSKVRASVITPVILASRRQVSFIEISIPASEVPADSGGIHYMTENSARVTEISADKLQTFNAPALKRASEHVFFFYDTGSEKVRVSVPKNTLSISIVRGRGSNLENLENIMQIEAGSRGTPSSERIYALFMTKAPALPATATSDLRAVATFDVTEGGKTPGTVKASGDIPPTPSSEKPTLGGKVVELKGRPRWERRPRE
jgi:hypothetical protein